jgi:hypothetical protein
VSRAIEWILLGAASLLAITIGVRWHRPARVLPWWLLAGADTGDANIDLYEALGQDDIARAYCLARL